jgi:fatty-acyl-CoA synthase
MVDATGRLTYAELWATACAFARQLGHAGLRPGDRVAVAMEPGASYVAVMLGILASGGVAAPVNTRLTPVEVDEYLRRVAARWHVHSPSCAGLLPASAPGRLAIGATVGAGARLEPPAPAEDAPAFAFPTGGTTGTPKAAVWTQRSLFLAVSSSCANLGVRPDDVELYISPFFHVTLVPGLFATLMMGGTVTVPARVDAAECAAVLRSGQVTRMFGTPTVLDRIVTQMGSDVAAGVAPTIIYGAARSDDTFVDRLGRAFPGARLFSGYGATEFGAVVRLYPPDVEAGGRGVGRPVPGVHLRVVDVDGNDVPPGVHGEIAVASPWQMEGYLAGDGDSHPQADVLDDGAIRSGDIGHLDGHGYLHLDGRLKESIKTGGETVFPMEVERVLLAYPGVADAAVYGVDDDQWGQRVDAVVVMTDGAALDARALQAFCRAQLAGFKVPKRVHAVDALPYTGNMKLDRRRLPDLVSEGA